MNDTYLNQLSSTLKQYFPVSDNIIRILFDRCTIKTFLKGDIISKEGQSDAFEYFLLSGILHSFSVSSENLPVTTRIFITETVVTPHIVRTSDGRSLQTLGCLLDSVVAMIPMPDFNKLMQDHDDLHSFGYKVVENELALRTRREISLLTLTAKERLLRFRKEYRNLENLVPHSVIAGFLGITPVSFSRLRNELAES